MFGGRLNFLRLFSLRAWINSVKVAFFFKPPLRLLGKLWLPAVTVSDQEYNRYFPLSAKFSRVAMGKSIYFLYFLR